MSTETTERDWVEAIGAPAFSAIEEMTDAASVDYDRLEELRDERGDDPGHASDCARRGHGAAECTCYVSELRELQEAAGDCTDEDDARQRIEEDPLSIELGGWWTPGSEPEATEYRILLATGGPAVRIVGELGQYNEPSTASLEVQDWFKPWTEYPCDEEVLLRYVSFLYLGD